MESILRGSATYLVVWLIFRMTGKRSLAQITTFDAVLLLIISETAQSALTDNDNSFTNTVLLILTMVGMDVAFSCAKQRWSAVERIVDGLPLLVINRGMLCQEVMKKERIDGRGRRRGWHAQSEAMGVVGVTMHVVDVVQGVPRFLGRLFG